MNVEFIQQVGPAKWFWRTAVRQVSKRVLRRDLQMTLPTGRRMHLPMSSQSATETFITGADQDWGAEALFAKFASGDFIDAGAHVGYYSLYLSPLIRTAYAFEPDPRCFPGLRKNAEAGGNIQHVPVALSDKAGLATLDVSGSSAKSSLVGEGGLTVEVTTIDAFVATLDAPQIGAIKTDVERHDLAVLRGAVQTLASHQPLVVSEISPAELRDFAVEVGFTVWSRAVNGRTKMTFLVPGRLQHPFGEAATPAGFVQYS